MGFIIERIAQMQREGEEGGVALWLAIADRFKQLRPAGGAPMTTSAALSCAC
ncbi:MAG: hypothetical protein M0R03_06075 [Novosphingobium sp.]|nr:hypothetical protein [Novosphingobium sp.]